MWSCGGAIARVPEDATAFTGRSGAFWVAAETQWHDPAKDDELRPWSREAMAAVQPFASEGRYVNDVAETGEDVARTIYGAAKYERLAALKRMGSGQRLRLNQNIRPAAALGKLGTRRVEESSAPPSRHSAGTRYSMLPRAQLVSRRGWRIIRRAVSARRPRRRPRSTPDWNA